MTYPQWHKPQFHSNKLFDINLYFPNCWMSILSTAIQRFLFWPQRYTCLIKNWINCWRRYLKPQHFLSVPNPCPPFFFSVPSLPFNPCYLSLNAADNGSYQRLIKKGFFQPLLFVSTIERHATTRRHNNTKSSEFHPV